MKKRKICLVAIMALVLTGCNQKKVVEPETIIEKVPEEIIGEQKDENGCTTGAGFSFDQKIGACIRSWEIKETEERFAAKVVVDSLGKSKGLTILRVGKGGCENCYGVTLEKGEKHPKKAIYVEVKNGKIISN